MKYTALLIALEHFSDEEILPVPYAEKDVTELARVLARNRYACDEGNLLLGSVATKTRVESRLRKTLAELGPEDVLLVHYTGRVLESDDDVYLACYDSEVADPEHTAIPLGSLLKKLRGAKCGGVILLWDAHGAEAAAADGGSDLVDRQLKEFFGKAKHAACLAARQGTERAFVSGQQQRGVWLGHVIAALDGKAKRAQSKDGVVTVASLQKYLATEVPKTIREEFHGQKEQTPWSCGGDLTLADVSQQTAEETAADAALESLRDVRLFTNTRLDIRGLPGFLKHHRVPTIVNNLAEQFAEALTAQQLTDDLQQTYAFLRTTFAFKRVDLKSQGPTGGGGAIVTPYFNYEVSAALDPQSPSQIVFCRQITSIRAPDKLFTPAFEKTFDKVFDTLEIIRGAQIDLAALVDRIEDLGSDALKVAYDMDLTWCEITPAGLPAKVRATRDSFQVIARRKVGPRELIETFLAVQRLLAETCTREQLPFLPE